MRAVIVLVVCLVVGGAVAVVIHRDEPQMTAQSAAALVPDVPDSQQYAALEDRLRQERLDRAAAQLAQRRSATFALVLAEAATEGVRRQEAAERRKQREARLAAQPREPGGLVVGDSVSLGAESCLAPLGYEVDSEVGRQFAVGWQRLKVHAAQGLPDSVVIHLGTNGPFSSGEFQQVMDLMGSQRRVVWVTIHLPAMSQYAFAESLNSMIRDLGAQYDNVRIADFAAAVADHPEWMYGDGIHINGAGCDGFTQVVNEAVTDPVGG